jgi:amino acid transporter
VAGQRVFVRQATGLVREANILDMAVFNICGSVGIVFVTGLFWAYTIFPRTNMLWAIVIGGVLCSFMWLCWALLAATMPRVGGDYVYNSRILHPVIGFVGNFMSWVSSVLAMGLWTTWLTTVGLAGAFAIFGVLTNNTGLQKLSSSIVNPGTELVLGVLLLLAICAVAIRGLKASLFMQNLTFYLATAGLLLAAIVMLFTDPNSFAAHFNRFALPYTHRPDSYHYILGLSQQAGFTLPSKGGFSFSDTMGGIYVVLTVSIWAWSSAYMAGEMKGARSVRRQLTAMVGAGTVQILLLLLSAGLFFKAVGYDFFAAINYLNTAAPAKYPLPAPPYYSLLAGVMVSNPILVAIIVFSFILNIWAGLWELIGVMSRQMFAWSFDGLMPARLADVNPRTHSPLIAITLLGVLGIGMTVWAAYSTTFFTIWSMVGMLAFVMMAFTAISAIALPIVRPDIYERSAARVRVLGIPVIQVAGVLALVTEVVYFALLIRFPAVLGSVSLTQAFGAVLVVGVIGVVIFYGARLVRAQQGIDLSRAYSEIPPE